MPIGASAAIRSLPTGRPSASHLRLVNAPHLSSHSIREISRNLIQNGFHDLRLSNGAVGRLIYNEMGQNGCLKGVYIGFALMDPATDKFTVHGRVVFANDNGSLHGGYGLIGELEPPNTCPELAQDRSTPILVSEAIRQGYKGIGSALMQVLKGIGIEKGLAQIRILQSLSERSDNFYGNVLGFIPRGAGKWSYSLKANDAGLDGKLDQIVPLDMTITRGWQPMEKPAEDVVPALVLPEDSFASRVKNRLWGMFRSKAVAAQGA